MFMIILHTTLQMPGLSGSLVLPTKRKAKYRFHMAVMFTLYTKVTLTKAAYALKTYHCTTVQVYHIKQRQCHSKLDVN